MPYNVGQAVKVQFGHVGDKYGYSENVPCIIIDKIPVNKDKFIFQERYLIQNTFDDECIGMATEPLSHQRCLIKGDLHCIEVRVIGSKARTHSHVKTLDDARRDLGFKVKHKQKQAA